MFIFFLALSPRKTSPDHYLISLLPAWKQYMVVDHHRQNFICSMGTNRKSHSRLHLSADKEFFLSRDHIPPRLCFTINFLSLLVLLLFLPLFHYRLFHWWMEFYLRNPAIMSLFIVNISASYNSRLWPQSGIAPLLHFILDFYLLQFLLYGIRNMLMLRSTYIQHNVDVHVVVFTI